MPVENFHEPATPAIPEAASQPLPPENGSLKPALNWRSRWPGRLALVALGAAAVTPIGWCHRNQPAPAYLLDLSPVASQYSAKDQNSPLLNWQISNPRQVGELTLKTLAADGSLVGDPKHYDLSGTLPLDLQPYCSQTPQRLTCQKVPTAVRQPGQYRFELTLVSRSGRQAPEQKTSSLVTIVDTPAPLVLGLAPQQVIYSEAGPTVPGPNQAAPVGPAGVQLSWLIRSPESLQDLLLVVRQPAGPTLGGRRFSFRQAKQPGQLVIPDALKAFCQIRPDLVCRGVPTGMTAVGRYQFELTPVPVKLVASTAPSTRVSDVVEIKPRPVRIVAFTVNGRAAQPKYLVPVDQGQRLPGFRLSWRVEGGATTRVELLPSPGTVPMQGSLAVPFGPASSTTLTLRVSDGLNPPLIRALTVETFDPTPQAGTKPASGQAPPGPIPPRATPAAPSLPPVPPQDSQHPSLPQRLQPRSPADLNLRF